MQTLCKEDNA